MALSSFSDPVYEAIRAHIEANWTYAPIAWPNEEFDEAGINEWVKFEIFGTVYGQESMGADTQADNRWDEEGMICLHVMVRRGRGATHARGAAKSLADLFRGEHLLPEDNLVFMDANIGPGSAGDDEGNWHRTSVNIQWRHWEA